MYDPSMIYPKFSHFFMRDDFLIPSGKRKFRILCLLICKITYFGSHEIRIIHFVYNLRIRHRNLFYVFSPLVAKEVRGFIFSPLVS